MDDVTSKKALRIKKNDTVLVISGKSKGRKGKVLKVFPKTQRAIVEKVNMIIRNTRPRPPVVQGGRMEKEAPIHMSKLMLICGKCNTPTRTGKKVLDDGTKTRVCKQCGEFIDK
jgi:large subunit ribosomal protein L24